MRYTLVFLSMESYVGIILIQIILIFCQLALVQSGLYGCYRSDEIINSQILSPYCVSYISENVYISEIVGRRRLPELVAAKIDNFLNSTSRLTVSNDCFSKVVEAACRSIYQPCWQFDEIKSQEDQLCQSLSNECRNVIDSSRFCYHSSIIPDKLMVNNHNHNHHPSLESVPTSSYTYLSTTRLINQDPRSELSTLVLHSLGIISSSTDQDIHRQMTSESCPTGFVIPDDPSDSHVRWVGQTGCAVACLNPTYTAKEWDVFHLLAQIVPALGLPCILYLVLTWFLDKKGRKKYLVLCFSLPHAVACLWFLAVGSMSTENVLCKDNAVPITSEDGATICAAESIIALYALLAGSFSWCIQSVDLFSKLVLGFKYETFWATHLFLIFVLPIAPVLYLGISGSYGSNGMLPYCFTSISAPNNLDIAVFFLPTLASTTIGAVLMIPVLYKIVLTAAKVRIIPVSSSYGQPSPPSKRNTKVVVSSSEFNQQLQISASFKRRRNYKVLRTSTAFLYLFLSVWISWFSYRGIQYTSSDKFTSSFNDWTSCVFDHYDGILDSSWQNICGDHPAERMPLSFTCWSIMCFLGQAIVVASIFISFNVFLNNLKAVGNYLFRVLFGINSGSDKKSQYLGSGRQSQSRALSEMGL